MEYLGRDAGTAEDYVPWVEDHAFAHERNLLFDAPDHIPGIESELFRLVGPSPGYLKVQLYVPWILNFCRLNEVAHWSQLLPELEVEAVRPAGNRFPSETSQIA